MGFVLLLLKLKGTQGKLHTQFIRLGVVISFTITMYITGSRKNTLKFQFFFNIDVKRRCAVEYDAFKEIDYIVIGLIVGSKINKDVVSHGGL